MAGLTLDTGALIALMGEWWRGQRGPAANLLDSIDVEPMDRAIAERAGVVLGAIKKVDRKARENLLLVDAVVVIGAASSGSERVPSTRARHPRRAVLRRASRQDRPAAVEGSRAPLDDTLVGVTLDGRGLRMQAWGAAVVGAMLVAPLAAGRAAAQTLVVEAHLPTLPAYSVDITPDGTRVVVCGGLSGPMHVFARTGTSWAQEGLLSSPTDAVSISDDGATAVGISGGGLSGPSMTMLRRVGTTWTPTIVPHRRWYHSVGLTGDGTRMLACSDVYDDCDVYVVSATGVVLETTLGRGASGSWDIVTTYDGSRLGWVDFRGTEVFRRSGTTWTFEYLAPVAGSITDASGSLTSDGAHLVQWDQGIRQYTTFDRSGTSWTAGPVVTSSRQRDGDDTALSGNGARLFTRGWDALGQPHAWLFRRTGGSYAMAAETDLALSPIATTELGDRLVGQDCCGMGGTVILRIALLSGEPCASAGDCASGVCMGGCCDVACPAPPDAGVAPDAGADGGGADAGRDAGADVDATVGSDAGAAMDAGADTDTGTDAGAGIDASGIDASASIDATGIDASVVVDAALGRDAAIRADASGDAAGAMGDAGGSAARPSDGGCGCRAAGSDGGTRRGALALLAIVAALASRRRRPLQSVVAHGSLSRRQAGRWRSS